MATFVLVHGAWHGGWCWFKVAAALEARGHTVFAPDLPGHGRDRTGGLQTLDDYTAAIVDVLNACDEPATLVGHSMAGIIISAAGEAAPEKVAKLVYVTAFLLADGQSIGTILDRGHSTAVFAYLEPAAEGASSTVNPAGLRPLFYDDCSDEDVILARLLVTPQPYGPLQTPLQSTAGRLGRIPRVFVECLHDKTLPLAAQREMTAAIPCERIIALHSAHSPFFAQPEQLASALMDVAA